MKFTVSWLKDHLETSASLSEITDALTRVGLEVERIDDPAERLRGFVVASVIEAKQHPNADRLRLCLVDAGSGAPIQVVCGAPNARAGMKSVFAPVGTWIPGKQMALAKGVIRGVESNGMLCSAMELELSNEHDGIIELPSDAPTGTPYARYAGLEDATIEINLTPNRPDATGVQGIARDLAAAGVGKLKSAAIEPVEGRFPCPVQVRLEFERQDAHLAPFFALRLIRGVTNGPSPEWMRKRLSAIGLRPINALVDLTNYLTFDRGRPLHVFDADKVVGDLAVRRAREGEEIIALDGKTYRLTTDVVVIADDRGVESIAGVMGGEASGCDENTKNVLIESALWDPLTIARAGRDLGISTDARYRFERGVDPAFCAPGAELATRMALELCGGEPSELVTAGTVPVVERRIDFPWSEVLRQTGLELPISTMAGTLEKLGFGVMGQSANADHVFVAVPSWRPDVGGKADLVEEVIRIVGVDAIPATPLERAPTVAANVLTLLQKRTRSARRALATRGLVEAVTWSFVARDSALTFGGGAEELALAHPIAADLSDMRPSLAPGLLGAVSRNQARGARDLALFEVGQIFLTAAENGQRCAACGVRAGAAKPEAVGRHWTGASANVDLFDAKADATALLASLGVAVGGMSLVTPGPSWLHPGRSATLQFGPKQVIGWFGEFHPNVIERFDLKGPLCGFEITLDALPTPKARPTKARPKLELSEFMPLQRDFAFIVDRDVAAADLLKAVQSVERGLIGEASIFDLYEGVGVPQGKKSVGVSVTLQPRDKTLTETEIEAVSAKIVAEVAKRAGGTLRG